jgi:DNA-binding transcriptional regulator LsrR (DeoR family)
MTDSRNDLIAAFIVLVATECPQTTTAGLLRIERQLRMEWGGKRCYIVKAEDTDQRKAERD